MLDIELPTSWEWAELGDIADVNWGNTSLTKKSYVEHGFPAYSAAGNDGFVKDYEHDEEGIVLSAIGAGCGRCFWAEGKWTAIKNTITIVPYSNSVHAGYLLSFLNNPNIWPKRGGAQPFITLGDARILRIPLPPLAEQKRIFQACSCLAEKGYSARARLNSLNPLLGTLRQSILAAAFRGDLTREWREQNPDFEQAEKLLERIRIERRKRWEEAELAKMRAKGKTPRDDGWKAKYKEPEPVDTEGLPELPEGWCWIPGSFLFSWSSGKFLPQTAKFVGNVPIYGGNGISGHHNESLIEQPAIVVGRVGANCGNVHLTHGPSWITDNAIYSTASSKAIALEYALFFLGYSGINLLSRGGGQPYINQDALNTICFPLPSHKEQLAIIELVKRMMSLGDSMDNTLKDLAQKLELLSQSILSKAFHGELVPQDPNDEPASILLERIRQERAASPSKRQGRGRRRKAATG